MRIRRTGRPIRACGKHTKGKRTSRRVFAAECVDEPVPQHGTSIARNNPIAQRREIPLAANTNGQTTVRDKRDARLLVLARSATKQIVKSALLDIDG